MSSSSSSNSSEPVGPQNAPKKKQAKGRKYDEVMDQQDLVRAINLRKEFGRVRWLVSWYPQEDGFFLARLSCDKHPETVEALGQSRWLAIDSATRHLLDILHRQSESQINKSKG